MVPFKTSLTGTIDAPQGAYPFLNTVSKWAQKASGKDQSAEKTAAKPAEKPADNK
jgi:hypothetical protein